MNNIEYAATLRGETIEARRLNGRCESALPGLLKGTVVYGNTFVTASSFRVEELTVLDAPPEQIAYEYEVKVSAGIKAVRDARDYLEFLDAAGTPVMRFHYAKARGADGTTRTSAPVIDGVRKREGFQHGGFAVYDIAGDSIRIAVSVYVMCSCT